MCVTNTTYRRAQALSLVGQTNCQVNLASGLDQRLMGSYELTLPVKVDQPQVLGNVSYEPIAFESNTQKSRPKRRRKPQKPGKTAKMNDRHFVVHNYHDHSLDQDLPDEVVEEQEEDEHARRKGGVSVAFPLKLHSILDQVERDGLANVISWQAHGRCFVIHQPKQFVDIVMPKYFRQTKLTSFQRQLNLYGFCRLTRGNDAGGYYHELFLRGKPFLTKRMIRTKVKGTKFKAASSPDQEPDFYTMPPVIVTPHGSPHHESAAFEDVSEAPLAAPMSETFFSMFSNNQSQVNNSFSNPIEPYPLFAQSNWMQLAELQLQQQQQQQLQQQQFSSRMQQTNPADQILDEAVEEIFMDGAISDISDLDDFVRDWDPSGFAVKLDNDAQLGYMLDRLLED